MTIKVALALCLLSLVATRLTPITAFTDGKSIYVIANAQDESDGAANPATPWIVGEAAHLRGRTATDAAQLTQAQCNAMVGKTHYSRFDCTVTGTRGWRHTDGNYGWCDLNMDCAW